MIHKRPVMKNVNCRGLAQSHVASNTLADNIEDFQLVSTSHYVPPRSNISNIPVVSSKENHVLEVGIKQIKTRITVEEAAN